MRRVTLVVALLIAGAAAAAAEERQIGAKVGPSFAVVAFDPEQGERYGRRIAAGGGAFAVLPITRQFAVQIEALFNPKGAKLYAPEEDVTGTVLLRYFDVPVLARINGPRYGSRSFHVFGGPYLGVRMSAKRQISFAAGGITSGAREDMSSEVERFEVGFAGGAGADIGRRFVIDGRYSRGLTSLDTDTTDGVQIRNRGLSIMAGVRF
jgi:Outer membrane protein beta-barrel domain